MQSTDTHPAVEAAWISMLRKATPAQKFAQVRSLSEATLSLSRRAISRRSQTLCRDDVSWLFIKYHYGPDLADRFLAYMKRRSHENA